MYLIQMILQEMAERGGFELEEAPWDDIPGEWLSIIMKT